MAVTLEPVTVTARRIGDEQLEAAAAAGASDSDLAMIRQLKERAADFQLAYSELQRMGAAIARSGDNELMQEYGNLLARGDGIKAKVSAATKAISDAIAWARGAVGMQGMHRLADLGAWFIPIAVIAAATAVLGYWISDYIKFAKKFNEQQQIARDLVAAGVDPSSAQKQAADAVAATRPGLFSGSGGQTLLIVGLLAVGFLVWQQQQQR